MDYQSFLSGIAFDAALKSAGEASRRSLCLFDSPGFWIERQRWLPRLV